MEYETVSWASYLETQALIKVTCRYSPEEDRLSISGEATSGFVVHLWLSRRLAMGLLNHLEATEFTVLLRDDMNQSSIKGAQELSAAVSVPCSDTPSHNFLVTAIDINHDDTAIRIVFRSQDGNSAPPASLLLTHCACKEWITGLRRLCEVADWSLRDPSHSGGSVTKTCPAPTDTLH